MIRIDGQFVSATVYDITGKEAGKINYSSDNSLNIAQPGVYIIAVDNGGSVINKKVLVQ